MGNKLVNTDPKYREPNPQMDAFMDANAKEKLQHAEKREQARLEKRGLIDKFLDGIERVKMLMVRDKNRHMQNNGKQR